MFACQRASVTERQRSTAVGPVCTPGSRYVQEMIKDISRAALRVTADAHFCRKEALVVFQTQRVMQNCWIQGQI